MGIMEFFRKRKNLESNKQENVESESLVVKNIQESEQKKEFVSDLSFVELSNADWESFAKELKKEGVLSNSYITTPTSIDYSVTEDNSPVVELAFNSKTSDSIRKIRLLKDRAYLIVNGSIEAYPETQRNKVLNALWLNYRNRLRDNNMVETNRDGYIHVLRAREMMQKAKKMKQMKDIYNQEQAFLEKYQDVIFDDFDYYSIYEKNDNEFYSNVGILPKFIPSADIKYEHSISDDQVVPFTPRTLEFCILHMSDDLIIQCGDVVSEFEKKCRELQEYSCFESDDWDKVIEFGKKVLEKQYQIYCEELDGKIHD